MISLNKSSGEVIWQETVIALLSPSELLVFQCLLDNPDELVTREILLAVGWPGKVVQLNSLTVAIKNIRKVLANVSNEQIIETRHRKGYILHSDPLQAFTGDNVTLEQFDVAETTYNQADSSDPVTTLAPPSDNRLRLTFSYFFNICFYLLMAEMALWSLFITSLDSPLICYKIDRTNFCGYSELDQDDIETIQKKQVGLKVLISMAMIKKLVHCKSIKWISFILLFLYSISPFINGLGCDFQQQYERDDFSFHSTCKFGYVKSIAHNKVTGKVLKHEGILGVHGDTTIFIANKVQRITLKPEPYNDVYSVMNSDSLFIARHIYKGKEDWIVMTYPYYQVLKVNIRGKPSFW